jgi:hypothetical protein
MTLLSSPFFPFYEEEIFKAFSKHPESNTG